MKIKEKKELQTKSLEELRKLLVEARNERNQATLLLAQFKAKNTKEANSKRKDIAQIMTVMRMKESADAPAVAKAMADKGGDK